MSRFFTRKPEMAVTICSAIARRKGTPGGSLKHIRIGVGFNETGKSSRYWNYSTCNIGIDVQPESPSCIRSWFAYPKSPVAASSCYFQTSLGFNFKLLWM